MKFPRARVVNHILTLALIASNLGGTFARAQQSAPPAAAAANIPLPQGVQRITSVEGITEYNLPNGLKVLLFPDQSKQTITVNITYLCLLYTSPSPRDS